MKKIKAAIIGTGFGHYVIVKALKRFANFQIVSICGKNPQKTKLISINENIKSYYTNWKLMLENEKIDVLFIATLPALQFKILNYIKNKKIKYLFIEKPLANNYRNILKLFKIYSKKKNLIVDFLFLEIDLFQKFRTLYKKNKNNLYRISLRWSFNAFHFKYHKETWKKDLSKGGSYYFYFIHVIHYFNEIFGNIKKIEMIKLNQKKTNLYLEGYTSDNKKFSIHFDCNNKTKAEHSLEVFSNKDHIRLCNKSKNHVNGFILDYNLKNKKNVITQKKLVNKKNENDLRIDLICNLIKKLVMKQNIKKYNINSAFNASCQLEKILKYEI